MKILKYQVLIAHAKGEDGLAEQLAEPIRQAGYEVSHRGTVMVGESFTEEASKILSDGSPVVFCATARAIGAKWARRLVTAAKSKSRVFCIQMEEDADVDFLAFDEKIALYWQDPVKSTQDLIATLQKYYPLETLEDHIPMGTAAEQRYRELVLESCDIIDLVNLPESDRHIATRKLELRRLYVALRVQVEIALETDSEESAFKALEKRRKLKQLSLAKWLRETDEDNIPTSARVPVGERLAKARRLVVLGDPGAGKTTMIRWITTAYLLRLKKDPEWKDLPDVATLPNEDWLPIIIRCRDLNASCVKGALEDFLYLTLRKTEIGEAECTALQRLLPQKLQKGEALLLLDGLDEITDPAIRARFCQQIEQICVAYPQAPIIATSRIVGYREMGYRLGRGFEHVTVADFSRREKDDFARRWCALTELPERQAKATEELIQDIHSSDRIERLTGNPMLLTTMALVKRKVGKLPSRRAELYWEAIQVLLNWRREVDAPIDYREAIPQLEYIAYAMCDRGVQQLREDEILDLLYQMRQEYPQIHQLKDRKPEDFLRLLERRTGILIEAGHVRHAGQPVPVFEFRHLTLQEYLAGKALVAGHFPSRERELSLADIAGALAGRMSEVPVSEHESTDKRELAVTENWREALRLCTATCLDDDVDSLLEAILTPLAAEEGRATIRPRTVMAALCLADEPNVSNEIAESILQNFIEQIDDDDYWFWNSLKNIHIAAKEVANSIWGDSLKRLILKEYTNQLSPARDKYGDFYGAVFAQAPSGNSADEENLYDFFERYLLRLQSSNKEEILATIFIIRQTIVNSLFSNSIHRSYPYEIFQVETIVDEMQNILGVDPSIALAAAAANLLSFLSWNFPYNFWQPEEQELSTFIELIENPATDSGVVAPLISVLGAEKVTEVIHLLIAKLDDSNIGIQKAAASALGNIKDDRAIEPLLFKLDDPNENVRRAAASALGSIKHGRAVELLLTKLDDSNADVRRAVVSALRSIKDGRAVEPLLTKLDDSNAHVKIAVVSALGEIKDGRAVEPLLAKLDDPNTDVKIAVVSALGEIKDGRAVEPLLAKLDDPNTDVREAAASALGSIKDIRAVEPLLGKLDDFNTDVREAAAKILGEIKDIRAVEPLIAKLDDSNTDIQRGAASALGEIKDIRAVKPLIAKLGASNTDVRRVTASALGEIKDIRAVEPLIAKLDDPNADVRKVTASALGEIKDIRAVEPLIAKLDDPNRGVWEAAASALGEIKDIRAVEPLISKLDDPDADVRRVTASALGEIKDIRAVEPLIAKLDDPNRGVWEAAASALGEIKDIRAVEPLIAKLDDPDADVRRVTASALGDIKDIRAVEPLIAKLDDPNRGVRRTAASALGEIKDIRAVEPLIAKLDDPNADIRRVTASALGEIKDIRAVEPLIAKLDDPNRGVWEAAASALGEIKDIRAVEPLIAKLDDPNRGAWGTAASALGEIKDIRAVEPLIAKLKDSQQNVRRTAASALGEIKDIRAVEPLFIKLDDSNQDVRQAASEALVMLGNEKMIKEQLDLLAANQRDIRITALQTLSRLCEDKIDRKLLSRDLDALAPFLDLEEEINKTQIYRTAKTLEIPIEEVVARYKALARKFPLKLKFDVEFV